MIFEHTSYRAYMKCVLADRISERASYSLRAFASHLKVTPSMLSDVLRGKKNLSDEMALKIAVGLDLNQKETEYFCTLVQFESAKSPALKASLETKLHKLNSRKKVSDLSLDVFRMISDPLHISILELCTIERIAVTPLLVSRALKVTEFEAQAAIERLLRLELIEKQADGRLGKVNDNLIIQSHSPNSALRAYHKKMLEMAIGSLETQSPSEKFVGSETFAFDSAYLKKAEDLIEDCLSKLVLMARSSKTKDSIYHVGVQFFRMTENGEVK